MSRPLIAGFIALGLVAGASAVVISVSGTSDPRLAGMPAGSTASGGGVAPAESPVEVIGLPFVPGRALRFSTVGSTDHCTGGGCGLAGAESDLLEGSFGHAAGDENGIGNVIAPIDSLIGVFLGASQPSLTPAPGVTLDFSSAVSRDFATLSPLLKQPFFIGNGLRNDGMTVQSIFVPAGVTRLFLGTMDGFGWFNNIGELRVTVELQGLPEPATLVPFALAVSALGTFRRRKLY